MRDALDGPRGGALPAADLGALEGGPGGARGGQQAAADAEHDLGVGAHVHHQLHALAALRLLGQDDPGRVGADVAGDARQDVDPGARMARTPDLGGGDRPAPRRSPG